MSKNGPNNKKPDEENENGEMKVPPKTLLIWIAILGLIPLIMFLQRQAETGNQETINYAELQFLVENDLIEKGVINYDPQSRLQEITGLYKEHTVSNSGQIDYIMDENQAQALKAFHIKTVLMEPLEIK